MLPEVDSNPNSNTHSSPITHANDWCELIDMLNALTAGDRHRTEPVP